MDMEQIGKQYTQKKINYDDVTKDIKEYNPNWP